MLLSRLRKPDRLRFEGTVGSEGVRAPFWEVRETLSMFLEEVEESKGRGPDMDRVSNDYDTEK